MSDTIDRRAPLDPDGTVVIVGAGIGGLRTAEALRAQGFRGGLTLVGEERHPPYDRPPLTKQFLAGVWDAARVTLATPDKLAALGIEHLAGATATSLDVDGRRVVLDGDRALGADAIVVATGASPIWLPGTEGADGVFVVRTMEQSQALHDALVGLAVDERVVVIGGGFIGAEVASTAVGLGRRASILEKLDVPLEPVVGEEVGRWLVELHARAGVDVRGGVGVTGVAGRTEHAGPTVALDAGEHVRAGVVVVGVGVRPVTGWLTGSGLQLDDGVVTDASLFAADGVVAVGDLARFLWHRGGSSEQVRIEHWEVASQLGAQAATSLLAGRDVAPHVEIVPYFWSDQHGRKLQVLGHPSGTDEWTQVAGSLDEARFTFLYHRAGRLTGVLGLSSPRHVMQCHALVAARAPIGEALALFGDG